MDSAPIRQALKSKRSAAEGELDEVIGTEAGKKRKKTEVDSILFIPAWNYWL